MKRCNWILSILILSLYMVSCQQEVSDDEELSSSTGKGDDNPADITSVLSVLNDYSWLYKRTGLTGRFGAYRDFGTSERNYYDNLTEYERNHETYYYNWVITWPRANNGKYSLSGIYRFQEIKYEDGNIGGYLWLDRVDKLGSGLGVNRTNNFAKIQFGYKPADPDHVHFKVVCIPDLDIIKTCQFDDQGNLKSSFDSPF